LWPHTTPGAMALYEIYFCISTGNFYVNLNFSGAVVLEKKIFENLTYKNTVM
jgi:hypothetical protein